MENLTMTTNMEKKMDQILNELRDMRAEVSEIKKSIVKLEDPPKRMDNLEEDYPGMANELQAYKKENNELKERVKALEQYSHANNIIIGGIPVSKNENLREIIRLLAQKLDIAYISCTSTTNKKRGTTHNCKIHRPGKEECASKRSEKEKTQQLMPKPETKYSDFLRRPLHNGEQKTAVASQATKSSRSGQIRVGQRLQCTYKNIRR